MKNKYSTIFTIVSVLLIGSIAYAATTISSSIATDGNLLLNGSSSGTLTISVPSTVTTHTLTFPSAQAGATKFLKNDGSGNLSWDTAGISTFSSASDVTITSIASNELFKWNGSVWINNTLAELSLSSSDITDLGSYITDSSADAFTNKTFNANATGNVLSNVDVSDLAIGTDGELITWDASGNPTTVAAGTSGQSLKSNGSGAAPTFQSTSPWEHIETITLASTALSVSFTSISTDYKVFRLNMYVVNGHISAAIYIELRLNNDSGANYNYQKIDVGATSINGARVSSDNEFRIVGTNVDENNEAILELIIAKPVSSSPAQIIVTNGYEDSGIRLSLLGGEWNNTADLISRIDIIAIGGGIFGVDTQITLEGIKP